jgi:hypothetical protein
MDGLCFFCKSPCKNENDLSMVRFTSGAEGVLNERNDHSVVGACRQGIWRPQRYSLATPCLRRAATNTSRDSHDVSEADAATGKDDLFPVGRKKNGMPFGHPVKLNLE